MSGGTQIEVMKRTPVMVNGLSSKTGKMARLVAKAIIASPDFELWPAALTGPEETEI